MKHLWKVRTSDEKDRKSRTSISHCSFDMATTNFVNHRKVTIDEVIIDVDAPGFKELGVHEQVIERLRKFNADTPIQLRHDIIDLAHRIHDNVPTIVRQALAPTPAPVTVESIRLTERRKSCSDEKRARLQKLGFHLWQELRAGPDPRRKLDIESLAEFFGIVFPDPQSADLEIQWDDIRVKDVTFCLVRLCNNLPYLQKSQRHDSFYRVSNRYGACWFFGSDHQKFTNNISSDVRFGPGGISIPIRRRNFRLATFPEVVAMLASVRNAEGLPELHVA